MIKPTDAELEILSILWDKGKSSVKDVHEELPEERETGYTTTLKMMQIMTEKGMLAREKQGRGHIYYPIVKENETKNLFLRKMSDMLFNGSPAKLAMQALGQEKVTREDIDELKKLLDEMEKGK